MNLPAHPSAMEPRIADWEVRRLCKEGRLKEAVDALQESRARMHRESYISLLQLCSSTRRMPEGKQVHTHIIKCGVSSHLFLSNTLLTMYLNCGSMSDACQIFDGMRDRNIFSWTLMIGSYIKQGSGWHAIVLFEQMQQERVKPDKVSLANIVNACAIIVDLKQGKRIHAHILNKKLEFDIYVGNTLICMYAKCGSIGDAREVFDSLPLPDVISWNAMISGCNEHGKEMETLKLFREMKQSNVKPNRATFVMVARACIGINSLEKGRGLHQCIKDSECELDAILGSALIDMYSKCGSLIDARMVFDNIIMQDVVSWSAIITAYVQHGDGKEALVLFEKMHHAGLKPTIVTLLAVLNVCSRVAAPDLCKKIHDYIVKCGFELDVYLGSALVDMYGKCGNMDSACEVFNSMSVKNIVSWNAMISGYAKNCDCQHAVECYEQMHQDCLKPNEVTFASIIMACASTEALYKGRLMHASIINAGYIFDVFLGNTVIDMYMKCGAIHDGQIVFGGMPAHDVVSWNAVISQHSLYCGANAALNITTLMKEDGITPNQITYLSLFNNCASVGALEQGKEVFFHLMEIGFDIDVMLGNALLDMYVKCGALEDAYRHFYKMPLRTAISWTTMIASHTQSGDAEKVLELFKNMQLEGLRPDDITFISLLTAYSHAGLFDESHHFFVSMFPNHGITPSDKHYACMVDLLGRAACLSEAMDLIYSLPSEPCGTIWTMFLGACKVFKNVQIAEHAFKQLLLMESNNIAGYITLSSIYAASGQ